MLSFLVHAAFDYYNGYFQRINERLMYCFNGYVIYELMVRFDTREQVFWKKRNLDRRIW